MCPMSLQYDASVQLDYCESLWKLFGIELFPLKKFKLNLVHVQPNKRNVTKCRRMI